MDLVVTKWIAMEAAQKLVLMKENELAKRYPSELLETVKQFETQMSVAQEQKLAAEYGSSYVYPLAQSGILSELWKLAEEAGMGLEADLRKIPVRQETVEICEYFDINPYNACSGGALLLAIDRSEEYMAKLQQQGILAVRIGHLNHGNDRILWNDGNKRYLDRPQEEELIKFYRRTAKTEE